MAYMAPGRKAALDSHAKSLASGNSVRQQKAVIRLGKMGLKPHEQHYVHEQQARLNKMYPAPKPLNLKHEHGSGFGTVENIGKGLLHVAEEALPSKQDIQHPLRFNSKSAKQQWGTLVTHPVREVQQTRRGKYGKDAQGALNTVDQTTGFSAIKNIGHDPLSGGLALAGILPFGKAAELGRLGGAAKAGEAADKAAQAAQDASGLRKMALQRKAARFSRRANSPEEAHAILQQEAEKATARATKAARKNPQFVEHLPGEHRPETGGEVGLKVREAMRGVKKTYKQEKELQKPEVAKRTAALDTQLKAAKNFEEAARAKKVLAGEMPTAKFKSFEPLKPLLEDIKAHVDSVNMLPHDRSRLFSAIKAGVAGKVPRPAERKLIESVFGREVKQLSPEAIAERGIGRTLVDVGNVPRALMSSFDLSGAFRQNLGAIFHNPKLVFGNYHEALHATVSEAKFQELMSRDVYSHPLYHMAKSDGVPFTEVGGVNKAEEGFASNVAEHLHEVPGIRSVPGVKHAAKAVSTGVRVSDRNYVYLLNKTRMSEYEAFAGQAADNGWRLDGPQGEKLRKQIADTVATLTGRGNWGKHIAAHRATYNMLFFSPGLIKSRIDLLNPVWYVHAEPFVRQQRLKIALRLYGTLNLILWSAKMAGAKVSTDPTNADFGKIRIGNTRIDPAGGLTQYMRLIGQLEQGKITSSVTGKIEPLSNGPFKTSRGNVTQQFLRNKLAPIPGLAYDLGFGPGIGQKLTPKSIAGSMFVPLLMQDMWQITHAKGPGGGPGMAAETFFPDLLGIGVQNYGGQKSKSSNSSGSSFGGGSGGSFGGGSGSSFP